MLKVFAIVVSLSLKQLRHFYGSRHSFPKIFMFSLRYINCLCNLSCLPLGEGAERSEAEGGCELTEGGCKHMKLWEEKRGSPRGELAPARATERGLQFIGLHLNLD